MNSKAIALALIAALAGLAAGFVLANTLNRSTINALKTQLDQRAAQPTNSNRSGSGELSMAPEEIAARIAEADANPTDFAFQKSLGRALYRFGTISRNADLVTQARRLLERARALNSKDYEVLVDLGNANFDIGYFRTEPASIEQARQLYQEALKMKPGDADVQTDLALTYYVIDPPDLNKALLEFERALKMKPDQERALQFLTSTHIRNADFDSATKSLEQLRAANANNSSIAALVRQIETRQYEPPQ